MKGAYHSTLSFLGADDLEVEPGTIRPTAHEIDEMTSEALHRYIEELGSVNARVKLRYKGERRTGHILSKHPHKYSLVPPAVAAAYALGLHHTSTMEVRAQAFGKLAEAQPQNAARMLARERSLFNIHLSDEVTVDLCEHLMACWADRFDDPDVTDGFVREACLSGGCEVFASLLDAQDFSLDDLQLAQALNSLQTAPIPAENHDFTLNLDFDAQSPQEQRNEQRTRGQNAYRRDIRPRMFGNMTPIGDMFTELLARPSNTNAYAACIVGMVAGGTALRSQEKGASAKNKGDNAVAFLGLVGAIA